MKNLFKISLSALFIFCLFTLGACANMHRGHPGEHRTMEASSPDVSADARKMSCHDGVGAKGGCVCATKSKGGQHECHNDCRGCMGCGGCKGHEGCGMHNKHGKRDCMSAKKGSCGGDGCGKCKEAGCKHCGHGAHGGPGAPGASCGK